MAYLLLLLLFLFLRVLIIIWNTKLSWQSLDDLEFWRHSPILSSHHLWVFGDTSGFLSWLMWGWDVFSDYLCSLFKYIVSFVYWINVFMFYFWNDFIVREWRLNTLFNYWFEIAPCSKYIFRMTYLSSNLNHFSSKCIETIVYGNSGEKIHFKEIKAS